MAWKYKFSEAELAEIRAVRRANTNKRAEARLEALELRAMGKTAKKSEQLRDFIQLISQR